MSTAGYVAMGLFFAVFIIALVVVIVRVKSAVKVEDADIPGQVRAITEKVVPDSIGYKAVPVQSKQSTGSMLKKGLKSAALTELTGYRIYSSQANEQFILVYGHMEMYFVPVYTDMRNKEIRANIKRTSQVTVEDLLKVKSNGSGSTVTLKFNNKEKFLFGSLHEFFFARATAKTERQEFAEFIHNFQSAVNGK